MITAVKRSEPRRVINNSPYYITTNHLPDFDYENDNIQRRVQVFTTRSLPSVTTGINGWIYDHVMSALGQRRTRYTPGTHCKGRIVVRANSIRDAYDTKQRNELALFTRYLSSWKIRALRNKCSPNTKSSIGNIACNSLINGESALWQRNRATTSTAIKRRLDVIDKFHDFKMPVFVSRHHTRHKRMEITSTNQHPTKFPKIDQTLHPIMERSVLMIRLYYTTALLLTVESLHRLLTMRKDVNQNPAAVTIGRNIPRQEVGISW